MIDDISRCYRVLEVQPGASPEAVRSAYRELVKVWHPDRFERDFKLQQRALERLKEINMAYERIEACLKSQNVAPSTRDSKNSIQPEDPSQTEFRNPNDGTRCGDASPKSPPLNQAVERKTHGWRTRVVLGFFVFGILLLGLNLRLIERWGLYRVRARAERGDADAQAQLARHYAGGDLVRANFAEAVDWAQKSANQSNWHGQFLLGVFHSLGHGVPQNDEEAFKWMVLSAQQGLPQAQEFLGDFYYEGRGVTRDLVEAHKWFNIVAAGEISSVQSSAARKRDNLARELSPAGLVEAQKRAGAFLAQAPSK